MTIKEAAEKYELTADTLRYYERIGLLPAVTRTAGGIRNYGENDCKWIEFIKCMRSAGLPVETLIEYVRLCEIGDSTTQARKELLIEQRAHLIERIEDMQKTLAKLNYKIDLYEKVVVPCEQELTKKD